VDSAFYSQLSLSQTGTGGGSELAGTVTSSQACGGPWSPQLQHGGPPNALLVLVAERLAAGAAGREDLVAVRTAAEFIGPVPVDELRISARISRLSAAAVLVSAELGTPGRASLQARVWLLAPGEQPGAGQHGPPDRRPDGASQSDGASQPDPSTLPSSGFDGVDGFPYARQLDWRWLSGAARRPGPAAVWIRPRIPLLAGYPLSTLQRAALLADSASGISAELSWDEWSFANVDLDLHLFRAGTGDWLLVDAATRLGAGVAVTRSRLADDLDGEVGAGLQTLLVRRR
jgi:hypothetical protein